MFTAIENYFEKNKSIFLYFIIFFVAWTLRVYFLSPLITFDNELIQRLINEGLRVAIWAIPPFLYLMYFDLVENPLKALKITSEIDWKNTLVYTFLGLAYVAGGIAVQVFFFHQKLVPASVGNIFVFLLNFVSLPLIEELTFRGFILEKLATTHKLWVAIVFQAFLFMLMHVPGWVMLRGLTPLFFKDLAGVFILGIIFGYIAKKSNSVLPAAVVHAINNLLVGYLV